jgi:hypothetical protein
VKSFKVHAAKLALLAVVFSVCGAPARADEAKSMAKAAVLLPVRAASVTQALLLAFLLQSFVALPIVVSNSAAASLTTSVAKSTFLQ